MKSFESTEKLIDKTKNGENVLNLEEVEVVSVPCNLADTNISKRLTHL